MKKEKLLKSILTMVVSVAIITTMSAKAFALTDDSIFADNDLTGTEQNSGGSTSTGTGSESSSGSSTSTGTSTGTGSSSSSTSTSTGSSTSTGTSTGTSTSTGSSSSTSTSTGSNSYNTNLPKAGLEENTLLIVAVIALAGVAVFAYRKVNYYKNI